MTRVDPSKTFYRILEKNVADFPKEPAIFYQGATIAYSSLLSIVNKMAQTFLDCGLKQGDTITLLSPNTPEAVAVFYAASQLGLKLSLLHPLSKLEQILLDKKEKGSKLLIIASILIPTLPGLLENGLSILAIEVKGSLPLIKKLLYPLAMKDDSFSWKKHPEVIRFSKQKKRCLEVVDYPSKEGRILLCSGGTSGKEKSIVLSDFAFLSLIKTVPTIVDDSEEGVAQYVMLAALPMFHGFGLAMGILTFLCYGGSIELLPKFRTQKALAVFSHRRKAVLIGVPVMYEALLKNPNFDEKKLKYLHEAFVGGDFISPSLIKRFDEKAKKAGSKGKLLEGYGLTETVTVLTVNRLSANKEGTIGQCLPGIEAIVIDEDGNVLPPNQEGELLFTGDTMMNGYLDGEDPFVEINGKRYVKTGDIGKIDEEGYLTFVSRKKRMIKKKGFNIYPLRIEKRISSIQGIDECAYYSKFGKTSEESYLDLVLGEGSEKQTVLKEVEQVLKKEFLEFEFPDHIQIKSDLPKTNVGKIDYKILQAEK